METERITCWTVDWHVGSNYTVTRDEWNCAEHYVKCDCPSLKADPDFAGLGVILAFSISASLTLLMSVICLLLHRNNDASKQSTYGTSFNPLDRFFRAQCCEPVQRMLGKRVSWVGARIAYDMVVCLSDQQLVVGNAILLAAILKLGELDLTVYHFSIVSDLAWLSSNVHLSSVLIVRGFNISVKPGGSPQRTEAHRQFTTSLPTLFRAIFICTLAGMLLYANYVSGARGWFEEYNCPAKCTLSNEKGGAEKDWMAANFVLIFYEYPSTVFLLWSGGRKYWMRHVRHYIVDNKGNQFTNLSGSAARQRWWPQRLVLKTWRAIWYFLASEVQEFIVQIIWQALGYWWLSIDRAIGHSLMTLSEETDENKFGFGQLVPLFMLFQLLLQFLESLKARTSEYN
ncbi:hypothetical protein F4778DRAFT_366536 [Xylariomycetidae sp. FL2044]|nr:hypothetical protein F4778DRAFT_366536 [Xylariomycetidae sp. FL2044]